MPSTEPLPGKCGSPLRKKPGQYCTQSPMENGRCQFHGGKSLRGPAHPRWKDGRTSRYATPRVLREVVERMRNDPNPLSSVDELIHLQAIGDVLLQRLDTGENEDAWKRLSGAMDEFTAAHRAGDAVAMAAQLDVMRQAIRDGESFQKGVHSVVEHFEATRKVRDTEIRRRQAEARALTPEDALIMLQHVSDMWLQAVREVARGADERRVISEVSSHVAALWRSDRDVAARHN